MHRGFLDPAEFEAVLCALHVRFESAPPIRAIRAHRLRLRARAMLRDLRVTLALDALVLLNVALITWEGSLAAPPATNASRSIFRFGFRRTFETRGISARGRRICAWRSRCASAWACRWRRCR